MGKDTKFVTESTRDSELERLAPITHKIIGSAVEVHRHLGPGLPEAVYERALCIEFDLRRISYQRQVSADAVYKGHRIGHYRIDFVVEDSIVLEVKSVTVLGRVFEGQMLTYLRLTRKRLGLLVNFHERLLADGVRRFVLWTENGCKRIVVFSVSQRLCG